MFKFLQRFKIETVGITLPGVSITIKPERREKDAIVTEKRDPIVWSADQFAQVVIQSGQAALGGQPIVFEPRCLYLITRRFEADTRFLVYRNLEKEDWGYLFLNAAFNPLVPIERQQSNLIHRVSRRLALPPECIELDIVQAGNLFLNIKDGVLGTVYT